MVTEPISLLCLGPYTFKARLADPSNDYYAIDPTVLVRNDGSLYLFWSGYSTSSWGDQNLYAASLSNPWTLSSSRAFIAGPTYDWERAAGAVNEAPEALQRNGRVFLTYSSPGCGSPNYSLGLLTAGDSTNLLLSTSWTKNSSPVFSRNDAANVFGPGHNGFFQSPDGTEDWFVYHAQPYGDGGCGDNCPRYFRAQKLSWNSDGTPQFPAATSLNTDLSFPAGDPAVQLGTAVVDTSVWYRIRGRQSGKNLDVNGSTDATAAGAPIDIWPDNGGLNQQWQFTSVSGRFYNITSRLSGKRLDVDGSKNAFADGTDLIQYADNGGGSNQQWGLVDAGGGYYKFVCRLTGKNMDVSGGSTADGSSVIQYQDNGGGSNQQWSLVKVN